MWQDMKSQIIYDREKFGISDMLSIDMLDTFVNSDVRKCCPKVQLDNMLQNSVFAFFISIAFLFQNNLFNHSAL
jgi:hypothetical protein